MSSGEKRTKDRVAGELPRGAPHAEFFHTKPDQRAIAQLKKDVAQKRQRTVDAKKNKKGK